MTQEKLKRASEKLKLMIEIFNTNLQELSHYCNNNISRSLISKIINCHIIPSKTAMYEIVRAFSRLSKERDIDSRFIWD